MIRKVQKHIYIIGAVLLYIFCLVPNAQAQEPEVRLMADSTFIRLGDALELTLSVTYPQEQSEFTFPPYLDTLAGFEVLDVSPIFRKQVENKFEQAQRLTVIRFDTGSFKVPPQKIMYQETGTSEPFQLESNALLIDVLAIEVDTTAAYMPIKGIAKIGISWEEVWPWLLIGLVVLGIIAYLVYRFTRKKEGPVIEVSVPGIPPHEIAMKQLASLESEKLWQKGELKEYYVKLTGIIREYIEALFRIPAMESITDEIIRDLSQTQTPSKQLEKLAPFLQMADLAKFAKFKPSEKENLDNMEVAREFVKETRKFYKQKEPLQESSPAPEQEDNLPKADAEVADVKEL